MRRRLLLLLLCAVAVCLLGAGGAYVWVKGAFQAPSSTAEDSIVMIERGSGIAQVARHLQQAGVLAEPRVFRFGLRLFGDGRPLKAGEYRIPAGASPAEIAKILQDGVTVVHRITIAEGLTSHEVVEVLRADTVLVGEITVVPAEGTLLPETYHFHRGDTRADLIARMQRALRETVDELWASRRRDLPLRSPEEAIVLASIVEKETGLAEERPHVASVFVNRLVRGMRLQSDPTVVYGITGGTGPLGRPLTRADLNAKTPYNTYQIDGLPPGPIANPGRASIAAVLDPLRTEDLYFVADGNGGHAFSKTLQEHNRNVRAWRKQQKSD